MKADLVCPICGNSSKYLADRYDDRYGYPSSFPIRQCTNCGHLFLLANFTPEELNALYSNYYPRSNFDIETYRPYTETHGFLAWLNGDKSATYRWIPKNVRILDIGCGFGESLAYHQARGCDVYGVEVDSNIQRVMDKFGYQVHVGLFDSNLYEENFFDYVTMSQVIEHVTDPMQTLSGIARILKPDGLAILSTPNACGWGAKVFSRRWINWHAPYHLQFFSQQSMNLAAKQAGLIVEKTITITPSAWLYYQWIHLCNYPLKGKPSVFWTPGEKKSSMQKILLKLLSKVHRCKINHVITRFFDVFGLGDNQLYFLRKP